MSVSSASPVSCPISAAKTVASAAGGDLESLRRGKHRDEALSVMGRGLAVIARRLFDEGKLNGILGMGGSGGTTIATAGMRALPLGVPKLMVSTIASGDVRAFVGTSGHCHDALYRRCGWYQPHQR